MLACKLTSLLVSRSLGIW